jgi:hypothetical protein
MARRVSSLGGKVGVYTRAVATAAVAVLGGLDTFVVTITVTATPPTRSPTSTTGLPLPLRVRLVMEVVVGAAAPPSAAERLGLYMMWSLIGRANLFRIGSGLSVPLHGVLASFNPQLLACVSSAVRARQQRASASVRQQHAPNRPLNRSNPSVQHTAFQFGVMPWVLVHRTLPAMGADGARATTRGDDQRYGSGAPVDSRQVYT